MAPARCSACPRTTSATSTSRANTACRSAASSPTATRTDPVFVGDEAYTGARHAGEFALPRRHGRRGRQARGDRARRGRRLGQGHDRLPPARLGRQPPALLGHADPDHPLRRVRRGAGAASDQLPVVLPEDVSFDVPGNPLDRHPTWKHVACPSCGGAARRETDTLDTFVNSSLVFHPLRQPARGQAVRPRGRRAAGCRSASISAGSSMRSCTCSTRASGRAR